MSLFVTGTDTEVGKTFFTALLVRALRSLGMDAVGFKPVACGDWADVDALLAVSGDGESRSTLCALHFDLPASPLTAAFSEQATIDPSLILSAYRDLAARHEIVVVEGVGGWLVPITPDYNVADLATELALPVVVVVRNRLGALNHSLLTVESIERRDLRCAGLVLNHFDASEDPVMRSNRAALELLRTVPVLCELQRNQADIDPSVAGRLAAL